MLHGAINVSISAHDLFAIPFSLAAQAWYSILTVRLVVASLMLGLARLAMAGCDCLAPLRCTSDERSSCYELATKEAIAGLRKQGADHGSTLTPERWSKVVAAAGKGIEELARGYSDRDPPAIEDMGRVGKKAAAALLAGDAQDWDAPTREFSSNVVVAVVAAWGIDLSNRAADRLTQLAKVAMMSGLDDFANRGSLELSVSLRAYRSAKKKGPPSSTEELLAFREWTQSFDAMVPTVEAARSGLGDDSTAIYLLTARGQFPIAPYRRLFAKKGALTEADLVHAFLGDN